MRRVNKEHPPYLDLGIPIIRPDKNNLQKEVLCRLDAGYLSSNSPEKALIIFLSLLQQQGSAQVAHRVQKLVYRPSQLIEDKLSDGSLIISFEISGIAEMITWIGQLGDMVEVLGPGWLRDDICQFARRMLTVR